MRNHVAWKIIGIGTIRIRIYDKIVRTLTHILDLKKNPISLSTLDFIGYIYSGGGGVIKFSKSSLVVMKDNKMVSTFFKAVQ